MRIAKDAQTSPARHRFLDEAGDTTFFGKGRRIILGEEGVSLTFGIGMVKISSDLSQTRLDVLQLQKEIAVDNYTNVIPSVKRKIEKGGFFFHATDDPPEVREKFYKYIKQLNCSLEMVVGRKIPSLFIRKHHRKEAVFYADILSHLLKNKLRANDKLVLNIAQRKNSTSHQNLQLALNKAGARASKKHTYNDQQAVVTFNVQNNRSEPILNIADYLCWAVQRVFERGEMRHYQFIQEKISLVVDLYDEQRYEGSKNYYRRGNPLTAKNKISPPTS